MSQDAYILFLDANDHGLQSVSMGHQPDNGISNSLAPEKSIYMKQFQNVQSDSRSRRGKAANRRHTLRITRIGRRSPTRILRSRGRFEIASYFKTAHKPIQLFGKSIELIGAQADLSAAVGYLP